MLFYGKQRSYISRLDQHLKITILGKYIAIRLEIFYMEKCYNRQKNDSKLVTQLCVLGSYEYGSIVLLLLYLITNNLTFTKIQMSKLHKITVFLYIQMPYQLLLMFAFIICCFGNLEDAVDNCCYQNKNNVSSDTHKHR